MTRAAIYLRYSTDKQRETSIIDQARICRQKADALGWTVVSVHADEGISGSTHVEARAGGARLLADAMAGRIDAVVLEGLDRLSRDQVEQERIVRRCEHRGIHIVGVSDGYDSKMQARKVLRGVRGLVNELYLDDLRHKTHRGLSGQFDRGFSAGGKSYGYRLVKTEGGSEFEIDEEQAKWVRWIFQQFADGWSAQKIAFELNSRGIPSPRKGTWAVSALYGSPDKGSGVLNNELYIGRYVWNRSQWVKDPDTTKRQRVDRPESEWLRRDVPHLRIIDDELWEAVKKRRAGPRETGGAGKGRRAKTLFGGLLKCPHCNGPVIATDKYAYTCAARKDRGPTVCEGVRLPRKITDTRLLAVLREDLFSPAGEAEIERTVRALLAERLKEGSKATTAAKSRITELDGEIAKLVEAIATVGVSEALASRLRAAEAERAKLAIVNLAAERPPVKPTDIRQHIKGIMMHLERALKKDVDRARAILADLFGDIKIEHECSGSDISYSVVFQRLPDRVIFAVAQAGNAVNYRCMPPQPTTKVERLAPTPGPNKKHTSKARTSGLFAFLCAAAVRSSVDTPPHAGPRHLGDTLRHSTCLSAHGSHEILFQLRPASRLAHSHRRQPTARRLRSLQYDSLRESAQRGRHRARVERSGPAVQTRHRAALRFLDLACRLHGNR